ncbi:hypothetical protein [Amycolatopsis sulphurea]|uniref:hypothetical protein n=1 Tax=Amycolatopsis sulphurea TaxID=76022 RepID=UPI0011458130|nr:hypothetical protein [Amycolatopsis sulphurea]
MSRERCRSPSAGVPGAGTDVRPSVFDLHDDGFRCGQQCGHGGIQLGGQSPQAVYYHGPFVLFEPAEADVDRRPDQVVVQVNIAPVAAARPAVTISKNRSVSVTDTRGNMAINLTNSGSWNYPTVQIRASSIAVVWKTDSGREYGGIELGGVRPELRPEPPGQDQIPNRPLVQMAASIHASQCSIPAWATRCTVASR